MQRAKKFLQNTFRPLRLGVYLMSLFKLAVRIIKVEDNDNDKEKNHAGGTHAESSATWIYPD